jgi:hypothetical protein
MPGMVPSRPSAARVSDTERTGLPSFLDERALPTVNIRRPLWRRPVFRPVPFALVLAAILGAQRGYDIDTSAPSAQAALAMVLAQRGYACTADDVQWVHGPSGVRGAMIGGARALVRAQTPGNTFDLYLVGARLSPEGVLLEVGQIWNLTRTEAVDESRPLLQGPYAAYLTPQPSGDGTIVTGVHTIDLRGHPVASYTDFSRLQKWQTAVTSLQETGQADGIVHNAFALDPVAKDVQFHWVGEALAVKADGRAIGIDVEHGTPTEGEGWVRPVLDAKSRPGSLVTWAVDRVRGTSFGAERMQWVKFIAMSAGDWLKRTIGEKAETADEVANDFGDNITLGKASADSFTDPEIGWPPRPLDPILKPAMPGEGQWISLDHDPFITPTPGVPAPFVTTFVRSDPKRPATRISIMLWDPRQIALHMEAGTIEPVSATGEAGPGLIPRVPEVMRRVVAGFNGGFQAVHGEYGMQVNGINYLPPKPYAATVLEMRDGSTGFGAWPADTHVPDDVLSYRQNMTAIVQNDRFNPWGRVWWGGTPEKWVDNIHTTRSAVCLTKEKFAGYFFGVDIAPDALAGAMLAARCSFGVHLDMNPGLAGFEFYNVGLADKWQPLGRPLQPDWEYEGTFKDLPDLKYRARRMLRSSMQHINFPRYMQRDGRDFFYLTARYVLPGADLDIHGSPAEPGEGAWRVKGLPQHGFPYSVATTWTRPDPARPDFKLRVLRVDPRTVRAAAAPVNTGMGGGAGPGSGSPGVEEAPPIVSFGAEARRGRATGKDTGPASASASASAAASGAGAAMPGPPPDLTLYLASGVFTIAPAAPVPDALAITSGYASKKLGAGLSASHVRAAVGIQDEDGMLTWVELPPDAAADDRSVRAMDAFLAKMGCSTRALMTDARAVLGGSLDIAGDAAPALTGPIVRLVRGNPPGAHQVFEDTPIVSPNVWQPLQSQRVRYFYHPPPAATPASGGGGVGGGSGSGSGSSDGSGGGAGSGSSPSGDRPSPSPSPRAPGNAPGRGGGAARGGGETPSARDGTRPPH